MNENPVASGMGSLSKASTLVIESTMGSMICATKERTSLPRIRGQYLSRAVQCADWDIGKKRH